MQSKVGTVLASGVIGSTADAQPKRSALLAFRPPTATHPKSRMPDKKLRKDGSTCGMKHWTGSFPESANDTKVQHDSGASYPGHCTTSPRKNLRNA